MQIKLPKEEWDERKLPDVGVLPNFYDNELHAETQKNIMLETEKLTQKPTQYSWQEYILAYSTRRLKLKSKLVLHQICYACHSTSLVLMAKTILKLDEYLNCATEINDAILEVFHNKTNNLLRSY